MTEQEVKTKLALQGLDMEDFHKFMRGQTVGIYPDGSINYYECDVSNFLQPPKNRFFD